MDRFFKSVLLFCAGLYPTQIGAQLLSGHSVKISNTGACSINIGVGESARIPSSFICNITDIEALRKIDEHLFNLSLVERRYDGLVYYLPNTWRVVERGPMNGPGISAQPRPGTSHAQYSLKFEIYEDYNIALDSRQSSWFRDKFGKYLSPNGINYLSVSNEDIEISAKAELFFFDWYEEYINSDKKNNIIRLSDIADYMDNSSSVVRLASNSYCEGSELVEGNAPVFFSSDVKNDTNQVRYSLYINSLVYFPQKHGFNNADYGDIDRFLIFDFTQRPTNRMVSCRGKEINPGDVYKICSSILSQIAIENYGEYSC